MIDSQSGRRGGLILLATGTILSIVSGSPSTVELLERLAGLEAALAEWGAVIEALRAENAQLRRRLGAQLAQLVEAAVQ
jgi:hypothetical protein